jgi:hypothetical protein
VVEGQGVHTAFSSQPAQFQIIAYDRLGHPVMSGDDEFVVTCESALLLDPMICYAGKGTYTVTYTPKGSGSIRLHVGLGRSVPVGLPGSPFSVTVHKGDAEQERERLALELAHLRPVLGIEIAHASTPQKGLHIFTVRPNGPAEHAGLFADEYLYSLSDEHDEAVVLESNADFERMIKSKVPGDAVEAKVYAPLARTHARMDRCKHALAGAHALRMHTRACRHVRAHHWTH